MVSPGTENGTNTHKNAINILANSSPLKTFFNGRRDKKIKITDMIKANKDVSILWRKAIAKAVKKPASILILGSERCIKEFPSWNVLSNKSDPFPLFGLHDLRFCLLGRVFYKIFSAFFFVNKTIFFSLQAFSWQKIYCG